PLDLLVLRLHAVGEREDRQGDGENCDDAAGHGRSLGNAPDRRVEGGCGANARSGELSWGHASVPVLRRRPPGALGSPVVAADPVRSRRGAGRRAGRADLDAAVDPVPGPAAGRGRAALEGRRRTPGRAAQRRGRRGRRVRGRSARRGGGERDRGGRRRSGGCGALGSGRRGERGPGGPGGTAGSRRPRRGHRRRPLRSSREQTRSSRPVAPSTGIRSRPAAPARTALTGGRASRRAGSTITTGHCATITGTISANGASTATVYIRRVPRSPSRTARVRLPESASVGMSRRLLVSIRATASRPIAIEASSATQPTAPLSA